MEFFGKLRIRACRRRLPIRRRMPRGSMIRPLLATSTSTWEFFIFEAYWAQLTFRHNFNLQGGFDGGVLEISSFYINNCAFTDITDPTVGGNFDTGGYNAIIAAEPVVLSLAATHGAATLAASSRRR